MYADLIDIGESGYSAIYNRCMYSLACVTRIICRLERLWTSGCTKLDYLNFLSDNGWVWSNHRWWTDIMNDFPEVFDDQWICRELLSDSENDYVLDDELI